MTPEAEFLIGALPYLFAAACLFVLARTLD